MLDDALIIHKGNEVDIAAISYLKWFDNNKKHPSDKNEAQLELAETQFWNLIKEQVPNLRGTWVLDQVPQFRFLRRIE